MLPLLILPFLTLAFWALGGGTNTATGPTLSGKLQGLSLELPKPQFKEEKNQDKLSLYNQAKRNLQKQKEHSKSTILVKLGFAGDSEQEITNVGDDPGSLAVISIPAVTDERRVKALADPNEEKINQRLAQLSRLVHNKPELPGSSHKVQVPAPAMPNDKKRFSQDVDRLERMMRTMGSGNADNPEMQQLEDMLERILDIQHPERLKEKLNEKALEKQQNTLPIHAVTEQANITLLEVTPYILTTTYSSDTSGNSPPEQIRQGVEQNIFYSLHDAQVLSEEIGNTVEAAIHETQTLTTGAVVKIRLLQDLMLSGRLVSKGSLIYGTCRVNGERLAIEISTVRTQNSVITASLSVVDLDGLPGLFIPGAITRDAAKQGTGRLINQSLQLQPLNPSLGAQAASAGIEATKGLLNRQARQIKVTVKAGHRLLLQSQNPRI